MISLKYFHVIVLFAAVITLVVALTA